MPQETNLNVSPYFDDFDADKNYHKVLFKPGYPIQARELTTLQSILQNQIEQQGKHLFKEGSVVIPGNIRVDNPVPSVEIEDTYRGTPVSLYFDNLLGKKLRGSNSGVLGEVVYVLNNTESERNNYTLYLRYLESGGENFQNKTFLDGETLVLETPLIYGNLGFTVQVGEGICNTISNNSNSTGSSAVVTSGVYFVRGTFVNVSDQRILLDQYGSYPSYKVGFDVLESIVNADQDESLFDNAKGFSNYTAPGADRLKIELKLSKKLISDNEVDNFVEIMRIENGVPIFKKETTQYSLIRDELARRTFDESGNYFVKPFTVFVRDTLNDRTRTDGIYYENQLTSTGDTPSEDKMVYQIGPGKAYVNGYDVEKISPVEIVVNKPRTVRTIENEVIEYNAGTSLILNRVYGAPTVGLGTTAFVSLMDSRIGVSTHVAAGTTIGVARVYDFIPETDYVDNTSRVNLRLFDIQTFTTVGLTTNITSLSAPALIRGKRSKASGYLKENVSNSRLLTLYNVSGSFLENEPITINGIDDGRLINQVIDYNISDVKSIYSSAGISTFNADVVLSQKSPIAPSGTEFEISARSSGVSTIFAGLDNTFTNKLKSGDIVSYASTTLGGNIIYNRVESVATNGLSFTVSGITTVTSICDGLIPSTTIKVNNINKVFGVADSNNSSLMTRLRFENISSVNLENQQILQRRAFNNVNFSSGFIRLTITEPDLKFASFDEDRFVINYSDGSIEPMRFDKYDLNTTGKILTFYGLTKTSGTANVITTVVNNKPSHKIKTLNTATSIIVDKSKNTSSGIGTTTLNDGLSYSSVYGVRVQDQEICLNVPDVVRVLGVYESNDTLDPQLPKLQLTAFSGISNSNQDFVVGEQIIGQSSGAVALVLTKISTDSLEYIYLNQNQFAAGETVIGNTSKVTALVLTKTASTSKDITQNFYLDDGQRPSIYDYSRLIRRENTQDPKGKLKIIFQNYVINSGDTGEFITANSYPSSGFKYDVPLYGGYRSSDHIDIRPRVSTFMLSSNSKSPFEFESRKFDGQGQYSQYTLCPNENINISYSYYLPRKDYIYLTPTGEFKVAYGSPNEIPVLPELPINVLDIAKVTLPPYLYNIDNVKVDLSQHKRYRMVDISLIEDRVDRLEKYTTLSMLESKVENYTIKDAATGLDRFKCGFFVDNFSSNIYHDVENPLFRCTTDTSSNTLRPLHRTTSLELQLGSESIPGFSNSSITNADQSFPSTLGSTQVRLTGELITLNYSEQRYLYQDRASTTENVTPYLVGYWKGTIELRPSIENWIEEKTITNRTTVDLPPALWSTNDDIPIASETPNVSVGIPAFDWISNAKDTFQDTLWLGKKTWNTKDRHGVLSTELRKSAWKKGWGSQYGRGIIELTSRDLVDKKLSNGIVNGNTIRLEWSKKIGNGKKRDSYFDFVRQTVPPDVANDFITRITNARKRNKNIIVAEYTPPGGGNEGLNSPIIDPPIIDPPIIDEDTTTTIGHYSEPITYLRSRNIEFDVKALKPRTKFNSFFQYVDVNNFITPKLLEIRMVSGSFQIGEKVESDPHFTGSSIKFRLCNPNHKVGPYNSPTEVYSQNPYTLTPFETSYSGSSTILNVDTRSLQLSSETEFYGSVSKGMRLIGKTSGAVAVVTDIRLISDNSGRLIGSLFVPDPTVPGNPKWYNGQNVFRVVDTDSDAETPFASLGTTNITEINIITTRTPVIPPRPLPPLPPVQPIQQELDEERCNAPNTITVDPSISTAEQAFCGWFTFANNGEEVSPYEDVKTLIIKWNGSLIIKSGKSSSPNYNINDISPTGEIRSDTPLEFVRFGTNSKVDVASRDSLGGTRGPIGIRIGQYTYFPVLGKRATTTVVNTSENNRNERVNIFDVVRVKNSVIPPQLPQEKRRDPLAQSFLVEDESGVFVTSVDIFFETKDESTPVILQLRPMIAGVPSEVVIPFSEVVLDPSNVNLSADGSIPTRFTFPSPVYLSGPSKQVERTIDTEKDQSSEYAIVLLSDSPNYRVFISRLGENDILTGSRISTQPTLGSLFKSQNGSTWNPSQLEDLKFNLQRASFVNEGIVRFFNPKLSVGNRQSTVTPANSFVSLSKRIIVGLGSTGFNETNVVPGVTISQGSATGTLIGLAGSVSSAIVSEVGVGYTAGTFTDISLQTETGYGQGAVATIGVTTVGIATVTITSGGFGYLLGDSLKISRIGNLGYGGKVTVTSIGSTNAFVLDEVQGTFSVGITTLNYKTSTGITTIVGAGVTILSIVEDQYYDGLHMKVLHPNHGMHSPENYVKIEQFRPTSDTPNSTLSQELLSTDTQIVLQSGAGIGFTQFENLTVSASNPGYVIIGNEVIGYTGVSGDILTSSSPLRGLDGTQKQSYAANSPVFKYEFNGVSLRRINKIHNFSETDIEKHPIDLNSYFIKIDNGSTDFDGIGIGSDRTNNLYFRKTIQSGRSGTVLSNNIQYEIMSPNFNYISPSGTDITSRIRTFTGTSISGNEKSFVDAGYQDLPLNGRLYFQSPRIICSEVNEQRFITESPEGKSFGIDIILRSEDERVSPVIDINPLPSLILTSNLINNPVGLTTVSLYANDENVRGTFNDPHASVYVSKPISLALPANQLKVILSANKNETNDIRVLYQIYRQDQSFDEESYELFPGYSNYKLNGVGRSIVDVSLSDGSADVFVNEVNNGEFKEYTYTADNLPDFTAFSIKIVMAGTNQASPPLVSQLRAIATALPRI